MPEIRTGRPGLCHGVLYVVRDGRGPLSVFGHTSVGAFGISFHISVTATFQNRALMGSEFCDFLSTLLTFRLLKSFDKCKLLDSMTYGKIMAQLKRAKKVKLDDSGWQLIRISPASELLLQDLGLLPKPEKEEKRRPGRPKKIDIV